ncbi:MAG: hypothetical protein R3268_00045 [Acidiferrobacterales bacterium]|nr:hypothetical protein [Acidiferrobacterales bacterium]
MAYGRESYPKTIVVLTKTGKAVRGEMIKIQRVLNESPMLRALFGDQGKDACRMWAWNEVILPGGHRIMYQGAGQQARMIRSTLAIGDDTEDENNTKTQEALDNNFRAFTGGYLNTLDLFRGDKAVDIGTPVCNDCTVERLLEESRREKKLITMANGKEVYSGWVGLHYSAIVRDNPDDALEDGRPLWPEAHSMDYLLSEKEVAEGFGTLSVWYSEHMCQIVSDQDKFFEQYGYYRGTVETKGQNHYLHITHKGQQHTKRSTRLESLEKLDKPLVIPATVFMGVDPASSTSHRADRSVVMCVGVDKEDNRYVLPYWAGREKPMDVAEKVITQYQTYKPLRTNVETVAYQTMLKDYLMQRPDITGVADGGKPKQKKDDRLGGLQPIFGRGKVWLQPEMGLLESELDIFPNTGPRDCLDAFYYANQNTYLPMHGLPVEEEEKAKKRRRKSRRTTWLSVP